MRHEQAEHYAELSIIAIVGGVLSQCGLVVAGHDRFLRVVVVLARLLDDIQSEQCYGWLLEASTASVKGEVKESIDVLSGNSIFESAVWNVEASFSLRFFAATAARFRAAFSFAVGL